MAVRDVYCSFCARPTQVPTIMNGPPLCPECQRMADENEVATDERRGA
jgi:hypothetical protein